MRTIIMALLASSMLAGTAHAQDKPVIAPIPAWVKPSPAIDAAAKGDEAPVRILLSDQQIVFERGKEIAFTNVAVKIQTSQGLAAGNLSFPWRPATDTLNVHKLIIRRGSETIDVLASGQTFTVVRREQNLERATLDGVLTANIQPEGLQVGDILEFAVSLTSSDPVMAGHVEQVGAAWNGAQIGRARMRMQWPTELKIRTRATGGIALPKPVTAGGITTIDLAMNDVQPLIPTKMAPRRYAYGRLVEATDFQSWSDLAALMAPLYAKAAVLPAAGPLRVEADKIKAQSSDPVERAQAALALVQDRIRYVALAMGAGGYVPTDAETTWSRRYGDCKAKTVLLIALLRDLGIDAVPVAVSSQLGDGLDQRLPMIGLFDHVIVRATIGGRTYWLDGTRAGDAKLDRIATPGFEWGLPLIAQNAALVRLEQAPLAVPSEDVAIRIDASAGIAVPAPTHVETVIRGDDGLALNLTLSALAGDNRDRALREYWKGQYSFVEVKSATATYDAKAGEMRMVMDGAATMDWKDGWYETDGTAIGYQADFARDAGADATAPFAVPFPYHTRASETIVLPAGFDTMTLSENANVERIVAGIEYKRKASFDGKIFKVEKSERSIAPEFPASQAKAAQATLREMAKQTLYLRRPAAYRQTKAEIDAMLASEPADTQGFLDRGVALMLERQYANAIKDFDRAIARDPKNVAALANRGLSRVWTRDFAAAAGDLDAAAAIDDRNAVVYRARGLSAHMQDRYEPAIAAYSKALEIEPNNVFSLANRAKAYRSNGDNESALRDYAALIRLRPTEPDYYLMHASLLRAQGKLDEAAGDAGALAAASPKNTYAQVVAANIYSAADKRDAAAKAYDRALAIEPTAAYVYVNRGQNRPREDVAGRRADFESAIKLEPKSPDGLYAMAALQAETGDLVGAAASYTAILANDAEDSSALAARGVAYARMGDMARAEKDFTAVRKLNNPSLFNSMCWEKATAGVALQSALVDCNAAIAREPDNAAFLDSRGLVFLRLNRVDEAIADYDRAIARSKVISSFYGRGVAWSRKGDKAKADADMAAARAIEPKVDERFLRYGVTP